MNVTTHIPQDKLHYAVRLIRLVEGASDFNVTFFPTGYPFIVSTVDVKINITKKTEKNSAHTYLCGLTNHPFNMALSSTKKILIIQLQPWILSKLFPFSAFNFLNQEIPLIDVDKDFTLSIEDALDNLENGQDVVAKIKGLISSKLKFKDLDKRLLSAWQMMLMNKGNIKINEISNKVSLTNRRLEQLFKDQIGFSPKNYERIIRVQSSIFIHIINNRTQLEIPYGYFDQAHYINEVKTFMGMTPTKLSEYLEDPIQKATSLDSNIYSSSIVY